MENKTATANTNRLPSFLVIPCILVKDTQLQPLDLLVYGVIYWYTQLKNERCTASNLSISELLGADKGSVANSISRLHGKGYLKVVKDETYNQRKEIIPLVDFSTPSSNNEGLHQSMNPPSSNDEQNKNNNNKLSNKLDNEQSSSQEFGKPQINRILKEFTQVTGLQQPADKSPRNAAQSWLNCKDRSVDDFLPCLEYLVNDKGLDITTIGGVRRHFSEYSRDVLGVSQSTRKLTAEEQALMEARSI